MRNGNQVICADTKGPLLPFKGKGSVRCRLRELEDRHVAILERMRLTMEEFNVCFRPPRPAHLALHHQGGYHHLRWRAPAAVGGQAFLELCDSEAGRGLLQALPLTAQPVFLDFERRRLELNLASSLCRHEERRLRDYLAKLGALATWRRQNP